MSWYRLNINTEYQLQRFSVVLIVASTILSTGEIIIGTAQNQKSLN
jgi:hypothetical protein